MKGKKNAMANYSGMEAIIVRSSCSLKALMFPFSSELRILMSLHEWVWVGGIRKRTPEVHDGG